MLHKQHGKDVDKAKTVRGGMGLSSASDKHTHGEVQRQYDVCRVVYPSGKPMILHLLRCPGFGVKLLQPHPFIFEIKSANFNVIQEAELS
ncbi:MAG: hypothetical protein LWX54_08270 [Deltaproteobacteria bacterium]|jgi:hypothetical protein|nr:hypothetical protein [Deltaproteobacteria bacterium]